MNDLFGVNTDIDTVTRKLAEKNAKDFKDLMDNFDDLPPESQAAIKELQKKKIDPKTGLFEGEEPKDLDEILNDIKNNL